MNLRLYTLLGMVAVLAIPAVAQDRPLRRPPVVESASPIGVYLGAKGGIVASSPRRVFPSIIIGSSTTGSGEISSAQYGQVGTGNRFGVELTIPFSERVALTTELGMLTWVTRFAANPSTGRPASRFDVQSFNVTGGIMVNLLNDTSAYRDAGLRTVYLVGGIDIGAGHIANRFESLAVDSATSLVHTADGSFTSSDPFRNLVALRFGAGTRYALSTHFELQGEVAYDYALNSVFSRDVIPDNDFAVDNFMFRVGLGYRF